MSKRLAGVMLFALAACLLSGCDVRINEYEVTNLTARRIQALVVTNTRACSTQGQATAWSIVEPGSTYSTIGFDLGEDFRSCLVLADDSGRIFFSDRTSAGGSYEVRSASSVIRVGDADVYSIDAGWVLLIVLVPLGLGLIPAIFFTLQFFYRYYVSGSIRPPSPPFAPA